ncbi:caspase-9 isoform X1 [Sphaerodactylus townsendi]|uniref:caspase-9 isoform X1 n=1 Tax=Sphaerodactylus townsendi TaxID=933632 RepID=UPI002026C95E|nr:caspase-9 isoform X1 [Sphaerodactylus townsendi]
MEEAQRQLLQRSRVRLVEKLQVEPLWDLLVHREIFTQDMIEEIQRAGTRRDQARQLITDLQTRGKAALPTFIWCLRKTGQEDLAILLSEGCNRPQLQPVHIESNVVHSHAGQIDPGVETSEYLPSPAQERFQEPSCETTEGPVEKRTSRNDDMVYVLNSDPCGYCLIINNVTFSKESGLSTRTGSDVDCKRLEERFGSLHFQVLTRRNLTRQEIIRELQQLAGQDHRSLDCCLVVILSHGCQTRHNQFPGGILGTDGKPIAVEKIVSCFDGSHCPPLRGKPKLFFIQACGGEQKDRGFEVEVDPSVNQQHGSTLDSDATPFQIAAGDSDQPDAIAILPTPSDILVSYSTFPGFVSWRDKSSGSWYVETLDDILGKFARSEDLLVMLTRVQNSISAKDKYKQMPGNFNFLRKKFFFKAR